MHRRAPDHLGILALHAVGVVLLLIISYCRRLVPNLNTVLRVYFYRRAIAAVHESRATVFVDRLPWHAVESLPKLVWF